MVRTVSQETYAGTAGGRNEVDFMNGVAYQKHVGRKNLKKLNVGDSGWTQIAYGHCHIVALSTKGEVFTWGRGDMLGHDDEMDRDIPSKVEKLSGQTIIKVACGRLHTAAVTSEGKVFTWYVQ